MNPFLNPIFLGYSIKNYLFDINRAWRATPQQLQQYSKEAFKKIVHYSYRVPMYKKKYEQGGLDYHSISSIKDTASLPFITKKDFRRDFPQGVIPRGFNTDKAFLVSTSGSTGQPVSLYTDFYTIVKSLMGFIRELREYQVNWRKTKMTVIVDLTPESAEEAYLARYALPNIGRVFSLGNLQVLHVGDPVESLMTAIEGFSPEFLGGYPGVLRALAVLKKKGMGDGVEPRVMASSGAVLDQYTRGYIEGAFGCRVFDVYGSTEAGPVAFECQEGCMHVHSDFVVVECVDEEGQGVPVGTPGRVVVTKLYGRGTPVIRYTGMNDVVTFLDEECGCGLHTPVIGEIGGRRVDSIVLPGGRVVPPAAVTGVPGKVMHELGTDKILQFQIVQRARDHVEMLVVIDEELRDVGPSVECIFGEIIRRYQGMWGKDIRIEVREVQKIGREKNLQTPPRVVISHVEYTD